MISFGNVPASSVLPIPFDTFAGATGASITISGLAVTDIEVYKGTSMTQRSSDAGYVLMDTDGIDLDGITGIQGFSINLGDNTDAGFYAIGSFFWVVISAITVDGQTVNFLAATFRIIAAETVAGQPLVVTDSTSSGAITAGSFAAGAVDSSAIAANAIGSSEIATDAIGSAQVAASAVTEIQSGLSTYAGGAVASVTGNVGGNVVGSVASVAGAVGSVTGAVGSVAGNVVGSVGSLAAQAKADVNAEVVDVVRTDTNAEPTGAPAATATLQNKIDFIYEVLRNKITVSATAKTLFDDAGVAQWSKALADSGTVYTESEGA